MKNNFIQKRIIAFSIDYFTFFFFLIIIQFIVGLPFEKNMTLYSIEMVVFALFFCKDSIKGQSFGKKKMKLQVVNNSDLTQANPLKCLVRNFLLICWFIDIFLLLSNKRRLGDIITNCNVIEYQLQSNKNLHPKEILFIILSVVISLAFF